MCVPHVGFADECLVCPEQNFDPDKLTSNTGFLHGVCSNGNVSGCGLDLCQLLLYVAVGNETDFSFTITSVNRNDVR